jgi:cation diffusion facilitator family transporter
LEQNYELNNELIKRKKIAVAKSSLWAALFITTIKILAAYFSGSLAVLSEVFHSAIDIIACIMTIVFIKFASKPPDKDHHYGHDKGESFSALFQVLILFATSSYIIYEAINRLFLDKPHDLNIGLWTIGVLLITIFIDWRRSRALRKIAKETNSEALEADALHFSSDILTSSVVIIALLLTYLGISESADAIGAVIVSFIILYLGFNLAVRSFNSLMDKVPEGLYEDVLKAAEKVKGVEDISSCRIRTTGSKIFIDMTIFISRIIPFSRAHEITDAVERDIKEIAPNADIVIHAEPIETENETINDKIKMIVNEFGMRSHDIFSHKIDNEIFTELHIEVASTNDMVVAHDIITKIEEEIKQKIPVISHVKIHIDEPGDVVFETIDITERSGVIIDEVNKIMATTEEVNEHYEIKVISTAGKIRVSLSSEFKSSLSFEEVHDLVTLLESKIYLNLKEQNPNITNVIIHAEPGQK